MILLITGKGKGKTTSAIGQIVRALGHNQKVCLIQLFKGESFYGEQNILTKLENLDFFSFAKKHPFCFKEVSKEQVIKECEQSLNKLKEISQDNKYNLIVLEEFNIALRDNFIDEEKTVEDSLNIPKKISDHQILIFQKKLILQILTANGLKRTIQFLVKKLGLYQIIF